MKKAKHNIFRKYSQYEFWSFWQLYAVFVPLWFYYSLKNKHFLYFTACNPNLKYGGFFDYSKEELMQYVAQAFKPKSQFIHSEKELEFPFPFIAKPDVGERGIGVELIKNPEDWKQYLPQAAFPLIIQEYINFTEEFGLFYYQFPEEKEVSVFGITGKEFLQITGNGTSTLKELMQENFRAVLRKDYLHQKFQTRLQEILPENEVLLLEEIGNHNRGTYFYDATHLLTEPILKTISEVVQKVPEYFYGRLDVKAKSVEEFQAGNFVVLELNASNSEATQMFDEKYNAFDAYKIIREKLRIQERIAAQNLKKGFKPESLRKFAVELFRKLWT